ncbi:MAG TPA: hypothetical protein VKB46_20900 [Pyrinomonadaceae bacterium]|nr:hypothetical protein [Pyrinomonadaceae bacterium]
MKFRLSGTRRFLGCVGSLFIAGGFTGTVWAQGSATAPPPGAGAPGIINPRAADRQRQINEGRLRSAEMEATAELENQKHIQEVIVHMKEDFTRIQVVRNDIARNLVAHKPLDYSLIFEQTGEIHKRASRMNVYMLAHAPDSKETEAATDLPQEQMVGALVRLCKLVDSFTENPALKNVATVDANGLDKVKEDKARADKDLLAIIKLSEQIKKKADSFRGSH